jgi:hypothetical protein
LIDHLLLLKLQLKGVGQHLPGAAPAYPEVLAKRSNPLRAVAYKPVRVTLSPVALAFSNPYIYHIAGHYFLYKYHFAIYPCQASPFGSIFFNGYIFQ